MDEQRSGDGAVSAMAGRRALQLARPRDWVFAVLCLVMVVGTIGPWQVVYVPAGATVAAGTEHGLDRVEGAVVFWLSVVAGLVSFGVRSRRALAMMAASLALAGLVGFGLGFSAAAGSTRFGDFSNQVMTRTGYAHDTVRAVVGWGIGVGFAASAGLVAFTVALFAQGGAEASDTSRARGRRWGWPVAGLVGRARSSQRSG